MPDRSGLFGGRWFDAVPGYRLASVRAVLAVTTIVFHVPKFNGIIDAYTASLFHPAPAFAWIPSLTRSGGIAIMAAQHVAGWSLLFGWAPRSCAWFLAAAGFYVMSLDGEYYAHNAHFHLTLLALIGCATDRLSLRRLMTADDGEARCLAWPEHLIRIQLAIIFFYAALDKVLSPHWRLSGAVLAAQRLVDHGPGLVSLQRLNAAVLARSAGLLSAGTIAVESFLAAAFLVQPLWLAGAAMAGAFVLYLEFSLRPGTFAWDVLAALLVFAPAGDRGWTVPHSPTCLACRWNRSLLSPLDWLRRLHWVTTQNAAASELRHSSAAERARVGFQLIDPRGRRFAGFDALRVVPIVVPGPVLAVTVLARFGGGFLASRGYGPWDDLPFLMLGTWLALWVPGVARYIGRPIYAAAATAWEDRKSGGLTAGGSDGGCCLHARRVGVLDRSASAG